MIKKIGLIVLIIGLLIILSEGVKVFARGNVNDVNEVQIPDEDPGGVSWLPLIGATMMFVGAGIRLPEPKN